MLYHVSLFPVKQFYPRIPVSRCCGENSYISRISFSQFSALKALSAIPEGGRNISCMLKLGICPVLYVYTIPEDQCILVHYPEEKAKGIRYMGDILEYVPDSDLTGECWLLDKPDMDMFTCRTFYVSHIEFDISDVDLYIIKNIELEPCVNPESNLDRLFAKFRCKCKPDDPGLSEFYYPGNENAFLTYILDIFEEKGENYGI